MNTITSQFQLLHSSLFCIAVGLLNDKPIQDKAIKRTVIRRAAIKPTEVFLALRTEGILPCAGIEPAPLLHRQARDLAPSAAKAANGKCVTARIDETVNMLALDVFGIALIGDHHLAIGTAHGLAMLQDIILLIEHPGLFLRRGFSIKQVIRPTPRCRLE